MKTVDIFILCFFFISFVSYIVFNIFFFKTCRKVGVSIPSSYSTSYYIFSEDNGIGNLFFQVYLMTYTSFMMPMFHSVCSTGWEIILPYLALFGAVLISLSPDYKGEASPDKINSDGFMSLFKTAFKGRGLLHTIGAMLVFSSVLVLSFQKPFYIISLALLPIAFIPAFFTKTFLKSIIFWFEHYLFLLLPTIILIKFIFKCQGIYFN